MRVARKSIAKLFEGIDRFLQARSQNTIMLACLALSLLIGALDFRASSGLLIFYLVPISLAAWYGGSKVGAVIAIYCAGAWYFASSLSGGIAYFETHFDPWTLWSFTARLVIFLVLTIVIGKLRASLREQRQLVQFVVHDLRSPISSAITGLMTLQQSETSLGEVGREMVSLALVSNERALVLVNSLLDVAKLEAGSTRLRFECVELGDLVETCFKQVSLWAGGANIALRKEVTAKSGCLDVNLISRVIVNLLSNAIKFSPPGSEVVVSASPSSHSGLKFVVTDHGQGIPPEFVPSIFEPFEQAVGTKGGTGLGLTFCRLAVHAHGGKIWAESAVGKGTSMTFTLPLLEPISSASGGDAAPA